MKYGKPLPERVLIYFSFQRSNPHFQILFLFNKTLFHEYVLHSATFLSPLLINPHLNFKTVTGYQGLSHLSRILIKKWSVNEKRVRLPYTPLKRILLSTSFHLDQIPVQWVREIRLTMQSHDLCCFAGLHASSALANALNSSFYNIRFCMLINILSIGTMFLFILFQ